MFPLQRNFCNTWTAPSSSFSGGILYLANQQQIFWINEYHLFCLKTEEEECRRYLDGNRSSLNSPFR
jgi:hypothetical protein